MSARAKVTETEMYLVVDDHMHTISSHNRETIAMTEAKRLAAKEQRVYHLYQEKTQVRRKLLGFIRP